MFTLDFSKQYISVSPVLMSIYDKAKFSKYESLRLFCKFIFKVCKIFPIGHIVKKLSLDLLSEILRELLGILSTEKYIQKWNYTNDKFTFCRFMVNALNYNIIDCFF